MFLINAIFEIKETEREHFLQDINQLIESSRQETGCISYELFEATATENKFVMVETWADERAMELHNQNPVFQAFFQNVPNYVSAKPVVHVTKLEAAN